MQLTNNKLAIGLLLGIAFLAYITVNNWPISCDEVIPINASVTVVRGGERRLVGLNADTDMLRFGSLAPGTEVQRSFFAQISPISQPARALVTVTGNIQPWLRVEPTEAKLLPGTEKQKEFFTFLQVPRDAAEGDYSGKVLVCLDY